MRKKFVITLIAVMAFAGILAGCGGREEPADPSDEVSAMPEEDSRAGEDDPAAEAAGADSTSDSPAVYMTTDISSDGLIAVYEALQASPEGNIAVKLSTGEPGSNYLRTDP